MSETPGGLARCIAGEVDRGATPGAVWWVGEPRGPIATGCYGRAVVDPEPVSLSADTPFDLASLTKPLATGLLAVILEREGRFHWSATLGSIFPELESSPYAAATLHEAATHRAGFPAWSPLYASGTTHDAYLRAIAAAREPLPSGVTLYSDLGYVLLGFAVERAGGAPLDRLFDARIAHPLGLARCGFAGNGSRFRDAAATESRRAFERTLSGPGVLWAGEPETVARGQVHDGNAWGLGGVAGHAGLFGTAPEVAAIAMAMLDPGRLGLTAGDLDVMRRAGPEAGSRTVGFLLAKDSESVRGILPDDAIGHWGFTGTSLWIDVARARIYVLLANRIHPQVPKESFTATRRAFHAAASALA